MTKQEFVELLLANVRTNKWLSCTVDVEGRKVGVKAYRRWVQRLECCGITATVNECRTQREFSKQILQELEGVMR